jgi:hypothetical protein
VKKVQQAPKPSAVPAATADDGCPPFVNAHAKGLVVSIRVQPRASRDAVCGLQGNFLKIALTAPPVQGKANQQCLAFLAKQIGLAKSRLELIGSETGRFKRILVRLDPGLPADGQKQALVRRLARLAQ